MSPAAAAAAPEKVRQFRSAPSPEVGMARRCRRRQGRLVRRTATLAGALTILAALPAAHAADQLVTGTVAPQIGIGLDPGDVSGGTAAATVTRERRGDVLYVTVVPAG
jgi:hypothetical protein